MNDREAEIWEIVELHAQAAELNPNQAIDPETRKRRREKLYEGIKPYFNKIHDAFDIYTNGKDTPCEP